MKTITGTNWIWNGREYVEDTALIKAREALARARLLLEPLKKSLEKEALRKAAR